MVNMMRRSSYFGAFVVAAVALLCVLAGSSGAAAGETTRVNLDKLGTQAAGGHSFIPSLSADGRYVSFISSATNLVEGDTNGFNDVFVRDRQTGTTQRVNVNNSGEQANGRTYFPSAPISANGRYVAFLSDAPNLVSGDNNNTVDVFVHDMQTGTTQRANVDSSGQEANSYSYGELSISADGHYVAFISIASNLVANDTGSPDVFVHDLQTGATRRTSADISGNEENGSSFAPSISPDGRYVAFISSASDLVSGDTNNAVDVFVRDRDTDADGVFDEAGAALTQRVRLDCPYSVCNKDYVNHTTSISSDGRLVGFQFPDFNLVPGDTNGGDDIFVHDRATGTTQRVSVVGCRTQADGSSSVFSMSADGRYVAFRSNGTNLVEGDTNGFQDIFIRDRRMETTQRVSMDSSEEQANGGSHYPSISPDGRFVAFSADATNLVEGDTNDLSDIFVHERGSSTEPPSDCVAPTTTRVVSPQPNAAGWNNSDVSVTLNSTDAGGSGVKEIAYSINGGAPTTVRQSSVQIPVTREGTTTITYHSTDNADNAEPQQTLTVKIDKSAPSVSAWAPTGKGVARTTNAQAFFSERVNPDSVTTSTFKLYKCSSTTSTDCPTQINVAITKSPDGLSAALDPFGSNTTTLLAKSTKYKVVVATGVTDEAGNRLDQNATTTGNQNKAWYFTTGRV